MDATGSVVWARSYQGAAQDWVHAVALSSSGDLLLAGCTRSFGEGGSRLWVLRADERGSLEDCCFPVDQPLTLVEGDCVTMDLPLQVEPDAVVPEPTSALPRDLILEARPLCPSPGCAPLGCSDLTVGPGSCDYDPRTLSVSHTCGEGAVTVGWDFDGDTLAEEWGNPLTTTLPAGDLTVTAILTDGCPEPGPQTCSVSTEVSVRPSPEPRIQADGPTWFCAAAGESVTLDAGPFREFVWARNGMEIPGARARQYWATASGTYTVEIRASNNCWGSSPPLVVNALACGPKEVSDVRAGEPPLRIEARGAEVRIGAEPGATAYNVYSGPIGSWHPPSMESACFLDAWRDNGDGTVTLDLQAPSGRWVLVTASNAEGEGPAGPDGDGRERKDRGSWNLCGPHL